MTPNEIAKEVAQIIWGESAACRRAEKALIAQAVRAAIEQEREDCAKLAETPCSGEQDDITMEAKDRIAQAIRNRK